MTLIGTVCSASWMVQVSDRLLTKAGDKFDPNSSKIVLYAARNAVVSIGYSGPAFLDNAPTDQWIANWLSNANKARRNRRRARPSTRSRHLPPDIGWIIGLLRKGLFDAYERLPLGAKPPLSVVISGWQWRGSDTARSKPILYELHVPPQFDPGYADVLAPERWWFLEAPPEFSLIPTQSERIRQAFEKRLGRFPEQHQALEAITDLIREQAASTKLVSHNCLRVELTHPRVGKAEISYLRAAGEGAAISMMTDPPAGMGKPRKLVLRLEPGYSPWIVSGGVVAAPMQLVGDMEMDFGPFKLTARGSGPAKAAGSSLRLITGMFPLERPPDPNLN